MVIAEHHPFVDHPSFHEPDAERRYGGTLPPVPPVQLFSCYEDRNHAGLPAALSHEAQEQAFLRYNYARFRAATAPNERQRSRWAARASVCRDYIARYNLALVWLVIRQYKAPWTLNFDKDELQAIGSAGLVRAIDGYDASKGARFSTYAYYAILRAIQAECQKESTRRRNLPSWSLTTPYRGRGEDEDQIDRTAEVAGRRWQDAMAQGWAREEVAHAMQHATLTDQEQTVLTRYYGLDGLTKNGETLTDISHDLAVSRERVRQIEATALAKLRRVLLRKW